MENPKTTTLGYVNLVLVAGGVAAMTVFQIDAATVGLVIGALNAVGLLAAKDGGH